MSRQAEASPMNEVYLAAEERANRFNLLCLGVLCVIVLLSELLNELGVFTAPAIVMRLTAALGLAAFVTPALVFGIHRKATGSDRLLRWTGFKCLIVLSAFLGVMVFSVALTLHAVVLAVLPAVMAAQYRFKKLLLAFSLAGSAVVVLAGVYGGFFLGMTDRNFMKGMLTDLEASELSNRLLLATPRRMLELFTHYVCPRLLSVVAVDLAASGITKHNEDMLRQQAALADKVQEEMARRNSMQSHVIEDLAALIETRDQSTGEHVIRTKTYVGMIARAMRALGLHPEELTEALIEEMCNAAPLHDVGKISVSDRILLKPGKLTAEEFEEMKQHAPRGGRVIHNIFRNLEDPDFLRTAEEIAASHHEKWNGSGYPAGLKGEEIPLCARIMAAADVYDALVSPRVYKEPVSPEEALAIIEGDSGAHFDPEVVRAMVTVREELIAEARRPIQRETEA